jgi:hypothetical protein
MNTIRKGIVIIIIIVLFSVAVVTDNHDTAPPAQDYPDVPPDQDWGSPQYYNDLDWSSVNDFSQVQWDKVDFARIDSTDLSTILNRNPGALSNGQFFTKFDAKMRTFSAADFSQMPIAGLNTWLEKKGASNVKLGGGAGLKSYDGNSIGTTGSQSVSFDPSDLPKGVRFEVQANGCLKAAGDYDGCFSGTVVYEGDTLQTHGSFKDESGNDYVCSSGCMLTVGDDGTINTLQGRGTVNGKLARDLEQVSVNGDFITAIPSKLTSMLDGIELTSTSSVAYDGNTLRGNDITVHKSPENILFKGVRIGFKDAQGRIVATIQRGETHFSRNRCSSSMSPCISANGKKLTVYASGDSKLSLNAKGYEKVDIKEISDDSQMSLHEGKTKLGTFDKNGAHPRPGIKGTNLQVTYNKKKLDGAQAFQKMGKKDEHCVEDECVAVNMECPVK